MKAIEFPIKIKSSRKITVPRKYVKEIPANKNARVIILFDESKEDSDWNKLTLKQFFSGYPDKDSIYDKL